MSTFENKRLEGLIVSDHTVRGNLKLIFLKKTAFCFTEVDHGPFDDANDKNETCLTVMSENPNPSKSSHHIQETEV